MQISILLLPLNTSEKYLESETNTIGDIPFNILHMSILPGTVHLKKRKKTTLLHTEHLKIHILDANKHPLLLIIVMMSVQLYHVHWSQQMAKFLYSPLRSSTKLLTYCQDIP